MLTIKVVNFWYSVNGNRHWFVDKDSAYFHFRENYTKEFFNAMNPMNYINVDVTDLVIPTERIQ